MCFYIDTSYPQKRIVEKPIMVFKVGVFKNGFSTKKQTVEDIEIFRSLWQSRFFYYQDQENPLVDLEIQTERYCSTQVIYQGYHSFTTETFALSQGNPYRRIGIFIIPAQTEFYLNFQRKEIVSSQLIYKGPFSKELKTQLLKENDFYRIRNPHTR